MSNYNSTLQSNNTDLQAILNTINELPDACNGVELPTLVNEGSASDLLSGKQLIDSDGNVVTGTIAIKSTSNLTASGSVVTVPSGYYATQATKSVASATQATPTITVDASGLITATATQISGYVAAGTKSATQQLAFQAAKTITPTTASQIAVSSGYYTGGAITVKGDSNLIANNIKNGVSIFGVNGTYEGNGGNGAGTSMEDAIIAKTISGTYTNNRITNIGSYAFYYCTNLTSVNITEATNVGSYAFYNCSKLTTVNIPKLTIIDRNAFNLCTNLTSVNSPEVRTISNYAFANCSKLTTASFPKAGVVDSYAYRSCINLATAKFPEVTRIFEGAFNTCSKLTTISFPKASLIGSDAFGSCFNLVNFSFPQAKKISANAFINCSKMSSIYLTGSSLCGLAASNAFSKTGIWSNKGSIYVPASLLTAYKAATNWTYFSSRIFAYDNSAGGGAE